MKRKTRRHFSEAFKKEKVKMIEDRTMTVLQLGRIYEVSNVSVYNWSETTANRITRKGAGTGE